MTATTFLQKIVNTISFPYLRAAYIPTVYYTAFATSFWSMQATWYIYFLKYLSPVEIALVHTIGFIVGLTADLPTGYIADRFGRSRVLAIGLAVFSLGITLLGLVQAAWHIFALEIMIQIGLAGVSGALEAVLYDLSKNLASDQAKPADSNSLQADLSKDEIFNLIYSKVRVLNLVALITSAFIGGLLFQLSDRLPWIAMGIICAIASLLVVRIPVTKGIEEPESTTGRHHTIEAIKILSHKNLRYLLPSVLLLGGLAFNADWGIFYAGVFEELSINPTTIGFALAFFYSIGVAISNFHYKIYNFFGNYSGFKAYAMYCFVVLAAGSLFQFNGSLLSIVFLGLYILGSSSFLSYQTSVINAVASDEHRATALSTVGMSSKFLYLFLAPPMGYFFSEGQGGSNYAMLAIIALIGLSIIVITKPKQKKSHAI